VLPVGLTSLVTAASSCSGIVVFCLLFLLASDLKRAASLACNIALKRYDLFSPRSRAFSALLQSVQVDPDTEGPGLPMKESEEFRPFSRRLPEFKFWVASTRAVLYAFGMTFFEVGQRERVVSKEGWS